jgi:hypothetical protein
VKRVLSSALLFLAGFVLVPTAAGAATIVGPANPNPNPGGSQAINWPPGALLFTATAPPGVQLVAPADGVVTGWTLYTHQTDPGVTAQLRILSFAGSKSYVLAPAAGPVEPLAPTASPPVGPEFHNVRYSFHAQAPIAAGQIVAVHLTKPPLGGAMMPVLPYVAGSSWEYGCIGPACGSSVPTDATPVIAAQVKEQWLAMNATIEPDVDHDGLGDETQDSCVGVCQTVQPPAPPATAKKKCGKGKVRKHGKCVRKHKKHHGKMKS